MRYYDKATKTEAVKGFHNIKAKHVVSLPNDHFFFQQLPEDHEVIYKSDGMPDKIRKFNLSHFQKKVWHQLKTIRREKNMADLVYDNKAFNMDVESWESLNDALKRISLPDAPQTREWTTADNSIVTLNHDSLKAIITARIDRKDILHRASQHIRQIIFSSKDPEALDINKLYDDKITQLKEAV